MRSKVRFKEPKTHNHWSAVVLALLGCMLMENQALAQPEECLTMFATEYVEPETDPYFNTWYDKYDVMNHLLGDEYDPWDPASGVFEKEVKSYGVGSMRMRCAYHLWKLSVDHAVAFEKDEKAYLEGPNGQPLYDLTVTLGHLGRNPIDTLRMTSQPNLDYEDETARLFAHCEEWARSVLEVGLKRTKELGLSPLPPGYTWRKIGE